MAHRVLAGDSLYETVWDHKPPALYAAYALAELVFGYGPLAVTALGTGVALATLALLFALLREISGRFAAWTGAAIFVVVSSSTSLQANQPNVEVFLNLATVLALYAAGKGSLIVAGAALALGSLFKPNYVFLALPFAWLAWSGPSRWRDLGLVALPGFAAWMLLFAYFAVAGRLDPFLEAVFRFNWAYSSGLLASFRMAAADPWLLLPLGIREIGGLALASALWVLVHPGSHGPFRPAFFRLLFLGTLLAIATPGYFFPHYFQLWIPIFAIGAPLLLAGVLRSTAIDRPAARTALAGGALALLAIDLVPELARDLGRTPREISIAKYGPIFADAAALGEVVGRMTAPDDTVYQWGAETGIYFYSKRRAPTRYTYLHPLAFGSDAEKNQRKIQVRDEVTADPPRILVWSREHGVPRETFFADLVRERYRYDGSLGLFDVYERK